VRTVVRPAVPAPPSLPPQPGTAADCAAACPTCAMPCLGGPVRYRALHMCRQRHQWGALPG